MKVGWESSQIPEFISIILGILGNEGKTLKKIDEVDGSTHFYCQPPKLLSSESQKRTVWW